MAYLLIFFCAKPLWLVQISKEPSWRKLKFQTHNIIILDTNKTLGKLRFEKRGTEKFITF